MMRVGLMGFGRAGRAVAEVILQEPKTTLAWAMRKSLALNHRAVSEFLGIESDEPGLIFCQNELKVQDLLRDHPVDAIIDFSSPHALQYYGEIAAKKNISIVSAISNYDERNIKLLHRLAKKTRVLWSPNITLGINFLLAAARVLREIAPNADIEILEEHFAAKPEVSGTARIIAKTLGKDTKSIKSIRAGGIIGRHEILFGFPFQTVRLVHESISREAFGTGALFALEHLHKKENGLYTMQDLLLPYFNDSGERRSN